MCLLLCYMQCVYVYLRQCVIEVFCSTSTDKSKKSSSLLLTCKNKRTFEKEENTSLQKLWSRHPQRQYELSSIFKGPRVSGKHFYKDVYHACWRPLSTNSFSWRMGCTLLTWLSPVVLHVLQKDMSEDVWEHRRGMAC